MLVGLRSSVASGIIKTEFAAQTRVKTASIGWVSEAHTGKPALKRVVCDRCVEAIESIIVLGVEEIGAGEEAK